MKLATVVEFGCIGEEGIVEDLFLLGSQVLDVGEFLDALGEEQAFGGNEGGADFVERDADAATLCDSDGGFDIALGSPWDGWRLGMGRSNGEVGSPGGVDVGNGWKGVVFRAPEELEEIGIGFEGKFWDIAFSELEDGGERLVMFGAGGPGVGVRPEEATAELADVGGHGDIGDARMEEDGGFGACAECGQKFENVEAWRRRCSGHVDLRGRPGDFNV